MSRGSCPRRTSALRHPPSAGGSRRRAGCPPWRWTERACRLRRRRRSRRPAWPACRSRRRSQFRRPRRRPESLQAYVSFLRPLLVSGPSASLDASVVVAFMVAGTGTPAAMTSRIVIFGATGYTGRLVAERLAAHGASPVLAGRDESRLSELAARLGGLETVKADAMRRNSVFAAVQPGDVLVSTVGPFAKWGDAAVRAAIAASGSTYIDTTGEPVFIRRVFEELGGPAERAGVTLMPAMGFDYVPGALAGALALREAGPKAVRVDVGYFSLGMRNDGASAGTRESLVGATLNDNHAFRGGSVRTVRPAERVRSFEVKGKDRSAISVGGAEHYTLPPVHPTLGEVNVYLGWFGPLAKPLQASTLAGTVALRLPGVRALLQSAGERLVALAGAPEPGTTPKTLSWIAAIAYDALGEPLSEVHLTGTDAYDFTASFIAWAAQRAAGGNRPRATGAVGPVEAFGLDALEQGCAEAGISRLRVDVAAA